MIYFPLFVSATIVVFLCVHYDSYFYLAYVGYSPGFSASQQIKLCGSVYDLPCLLAPVTISH